VELWTEGQINISSGKQRCMVRTWCSVCVPIFPDEVVLSPYREKGSVWMSHGLRNYNDTSRLLWGPGDKVGAKVLLCPLPQILPGWVWCSDIPVPLWPQEQRGKCWRVNERGQQKNRPRSAPEQMCSAAPGQLQGNLMILCGGSTRMHVIVSRGWKAWGCVHFMSRHRK